MKDKITDIKMLQAVFDASEDGILIFDNRGIILKANSAAENLYGYRSGKLLQKNVTELISEKLDTLLKETLKQDKTNKSNQVDAIRGIKKDGSLFPLNLSLSPYLIDEREVIIAFFRDTPTQLAHNINEAKRKKSGLIEQDRKFNNLVNNLPCIVYGCKNTKNWEAYFVNKNCFDITGYNSEEFMSHKIHFGQLILEEDRDLVWSQIQEAILAKEPYSLKYRIRHKQGQIKYLWEQGESTFNNHKEEVVLEGFISDITDQKKMELDLITSRTRKSAILEALPDHIVVHDTNGTILNVLSADILLKPYPKEKVIGMNFREFVSDEEDRKRVLTIFSKVVQSKKIEIFELEIPIPNRTLLYEVRAVPFEKDKVLVVARDNTDSKEAERKLLESEAKTSAILKILPDLMIVYDRYGNHLEVHAPTNFQLSVPYDEHIGKNIDAILPKNVCEIIRRGFVDCETTKEIQTVEYSLIVEDTLRHLESRIIQTDDGNFLTVIRDMTEKRAINDLLYLRNSALSATINSIVITDARTADNPIIYANQAFKDTTGYKNSDFIGRNSRFLQSDDQEQEEIKTMESAIKNGKSCHVVLRNYKKDRTLFWNEIFLTPIYNNNKILTHYIGVQNDVSNRKREEFFKNNIRKILEQIANEKPLLHIMNSIVKTVEEDMNGCIASILLLDQENNTLHKLSSANLPEDFSNAIEGVKIGKNAGSCGTAAFLKQEVVVNNIAADPRWEGYKELAIKNGLKACWSFPIFSSTKTVLGTFAIYNYPNQKSHKRDKKNFVDFTHLASTAIEQHIINNELQSKSHQLEEYAQKLEEKVQERTNELNATVQQLVATNLNLKDQVEETKKAESELLSSRALFSMIAKNFPRGIITVFDKDFRIIYSAGEGLELAGINQFSFIGKTIDEIDVFTEERKTRLKTEVSRTLAGEHYYREIEINNIIFSINTIPLKNKANRITRALFVHNDISQQKKVEQNIQHALKKEQELNELKSKFISTASHEFRTPLSIILSSANLIEKQNGPEKEEKREKYLEKIKRSVENLVVILNDFLSLSKLEEGKVVAQPTFFDIISFSESIINEIKPSLKKGQKVSIKKENPLIDVYLDPKLMRHILHNLLSNASKYSGDNKDIFISVTSNSKYILLAIEDQGIGIPKEEQNNLFQRFFRAKNASAVQGTGLGLNIVKQYTELMNGSISFESELNKGTVFTLAFPIKK